MLSADAPFCLPFQSRASASFIEISFVVKADRDDSDEDLRLYAEESDDESGKESAGEFDDLIDCAFGLLSKRLTSAGLRWCGDLGVPTAVNRLLLSPGARCWLRNVFGLAD